MEKNNPGKVLQLNASNFFTNVFNKCNQDMSCAQGCDRCCFSQFSIYDWEAQLIQAWFLELDQSSQMQLKELWKRPTMMGNDASNVLQVSCSFLYDKQCSIYFARPIICRTQGLPLLVDGVVSACPLNFTQGMPDRSLWLDLERLNTLSAILAGNSQKRISMRDLKAILLKV